MKKQTAVVVGAGLGGLATAVRLQAQGHQVTVLEKLPDVGGRSNVIKEGGFSFDTGPTLLLMLEYLKGTFEAAGRKMEDYLEVLQLDPNYRIHFADGSDLTLTSRLNALVDEVERLEEGAGSKLLHYLGETAKMYRIGLRDFVDRNFLSPSSFFNLQNLGLLFTARATQKLYPMVSRYFKDERLRRAFSFQSMYLGLSPFDSPAIYALLPYTEMAGGLFFPKGGIHAIPAALAKLATDLGATVRTNCEVAKVEHAGGRATGVRLANGELIEADVVVVNADLPFAYQQLLGEKHPKHESFKYTCGAYLMYLGVNREYPQLLHHNLIVPDNLKANMDAIFKTHTIPDDPAFYICNPNKTDPSLAPAGHENLYILVPVPHEAEGTDWEQEAPRLRERMLDRLEAFGLTDLRKHIVVERMHSPLTFRTELNCEKGAAFGLSHGMDQVGFLRPHNRHASIGNLYFVGASTHPGTGIPMVLISGKLVAERIALEQKRPVPMPRQEANARAV